MSLYVINHRELRCNFSNGVRSKPNIWDMDARGMLFEPIALCCVILGMGVRRGGGGNRAQREGEGIEGSSIIWWSVSVFLLVDNNGMTNSKVRFILTDCFDPCALA